MSQLIKDISLGFLALCFIWGICISICICVRLLILHIKYREQEPPKVIEEEPEEKPTTILSTPVQPKKQRTKRKQPAKLYISLQQEQEEQ